MARSSRFSLVGLTVVAVLALAMEALVRATAHHLPPEFTQHFDPGIRHDVAASRDPLDGVDQRSVERDDGGPLLKIFEPNRWITSGFGGEGTASGVTTDALGFCNPPGPSPGGTEGAIVAIGDSLTWCTSVQPGEVWPAQLSQRLRAGVTNLGIPGIGLYEYLVLLRRYGLAQRPILVVMNVYEGNDLRDALRYWRHRENVTSQPPPSPSVSLPRRHSYALNLVTAAWKSTTGADARGWALDKTGLNFRYWLRREGRALPFNSHNADRDELAHAIALDQGAIDPSVLDGALQEFVRLAREHCFIALVTYTPSAHTAYDVYADFEDAEAGRVLRAYSGALRSYFANSAAEFGFRFLDLTGPLQTAASNGFDDPEAMLYYPGTVHFGVEGHRVAAEAIARFLVDQFPSGIEPACRPTPQAARFPS